MFDCQGRQHVALPVMGTLPPMIGEDRPAFQKQGLIPNRQHVPIPRPSHRNRGPPARSPGVPRNASREAHANAHPHTDQTSTRTTSLAPVALPAAGIGPSIICHLDVLSSLTAAETTCLEARAFGSCGDLKYGEGPPKRALQTRPPSFLNFSRLPYLQIVAGQYYRVLVVPSSGYSRFFSHVGQI
jgi:hypothetical protein